MKHEKNYLRLIELCKEYNGIDASVRNSRKHELVLVKGCIFNVLSKYFGATTTAIGKLFDLHHSTIVHHHAIHFTRYRYEDEYATLYDYLILKCNEMDKSFIDVEDVIKKINSALSTKKI